MATILKTGIIINDKESYKIYFAPKFDMIKCILIDGEVTRINR